MLENRVALLSRPTRSGRDDGQGRLRAGIRAFACLVLKTRRHDFVVYENDAVGIRVASSKDVPEAFAVASSEWFP